MSSLRSALAFLTILPAGGELGSGSVGFFWCAGLLVGVVIGLIWTIGTAIWGPVVGATLCVGVEVILTRGLHYDGVGDLADGLFVHGVDAARRREIMGDPRIGALGALTLIITVLLRVAILSDLHAAVGELIGVTVLSRVTLSIGLLMQAPAKTTGLVALFQDPPLRVGTYVVLGIGAVVGVVAQVVSSGLVAGLGSCAAVGVVGTALQVLAGRRLGGLTGDVLGASSVVGEVGGLLVLAGLGR
ncbi:MAG: adenosylcobinamide-GDP ribazoletransferase [Acidimicrobiales bacterium]